jgi:Ni,Fe-hydrogenase III large subunit
VTKASRTYREEVGHLLADGWTFGCLYASAAGDVVSTVLLSGDGKTHVESVPVESGSVPSVVDLAAEAAWDEREAHDLYGIGFVGHHPLQPLVEHDAELGHWTVAVHGRDPYQVAVGPIHAGVIESGHFRFHVVGDRILHLDARLFYKHRGLERAAEGMALGEGIAYAQRACGACAVSNAVAYAHACESALGLDCPQELARVRTILLELERVWSHVNDIAAVCSGVGLTAGTSYFSAMTERARRLNAELTGHRLLFGAVRVGESVLSVDASAVGRARARLATMREELRRGWRELVFNSSFVDRLPDVGVVGEADARRLGAVGPAARAAGVDEDMRMHQPRLRYEGFAPVLPERAAGDVQARLDQRHAELQQSFDVLEGLLHGRIDSSAARAVEPERARGVGAVESPRGRTVCVVECDGDRVARLHLRTGSFANWPVVAFAASENLLPDFPLINKSFELCYACADR